MVELPKEHIQFRQLYGNPPVRQWAYPLIKILVYEYEAFWNADELVTEQEW
jgi:hypothetical protein